jgi:hypothetical protein
MKTVLSGVSNYSNYEIIMFLYRKGFFLSDELISVRRTPDFGETQFSKDCNMRFTVSEAVNFNRLESLARIGWRI